MRPIALLLALLLAAAMPSMASDDTDRADASQTGAPQTAAPPEDEQAEAAAPAALGTCTNADLRGRWQVLLDADLVTPGTRGLLVSCQIRIGSAGAIAASECVRQSTSGSFGGFAGNLRIRPNCRVSNRNNAVSVTFSDNTVITNLRIAATMSGDRTRLTGTVIGFVTGHLKGTFEAIRVP